MSALQDAPAGPPICIRKQAGREASPSRSHIGLSSLCHALLGAEGSVYTYAARCSPFVMRVSLGLVFLWFGLLKFLPSTSGIDRLAETTIGIITFHVASPSLCLHLLAVWECLIGIGLILGLYLRATLMLLFLHLPGTFLPLILMPHACWYAVPFDPSLLGHYILKNFVLIAGGIVIAGNLSSHRNFQPDSA